MTVLKNYNGKDFFQNFILIYKLNVKAQSSQMIDNLYSAGLIAGISSEK